MLLDQGSNESEPSLADYLFVLPKLIWPKPPGKARWRTRVKNINERIVLVQQGKWKTLLELSMKPPLPTYEATPEEEFLDERGLSKEMARKLQAAACQRQVGKAWKQMRSPPPTELTAEVWEEAKGKLKPHADATPPLVDAKSWHPTVEQCTTVIYELKHNKAPDVGGWTTESAVRNGFVVPLPELGGESSYSTYCHLPITRCPKEIGPLQVYLDAHGPIDSLGHLASSRLRSTREN